MTTMNMLLSYAYTPGRHDPTGGGGFVRGDWRQIENALIAGLITDEEYERIAREAPTAKPTSATVTMFCPPSQPDEPTEFGARVTVTLPEGTPEKWLRVVSRDDWPWRNSDGDRHFWAYLIERGAVTLGWDE